MSNTIIFIFFYNRDILVKFKNVIYLEPILFDLDIEAFDIELLNQIIANKINKNIDVFII